MTAPEWLSFRTLLNSDVPMIAPVRRRLRMSAPTLPCGVWCARWKICSIAIRTVTFVCEALRHCARSVRRKCNKRR